MTKLMLLRMHIESCGNNTLANGNRCNIESLQQKVVRSWPRQWNRYVHISYAPLTVCDCDCDNPNDDMRTVLDKPSHATSIHKCLL